MMLFSRATRRYATDVGRAFERAPVECAATVLIAVVLSYALEHGEIANEAAHFTVSALLITAAAWSATLAHAMHAIRTRTRWIVTSAGAATAAAYLLFTGDIAYASEAFRAFMLLAAAALLVFVTPGMVLHPDDGTLRMRRINSRFFLRAVGIKLYGLALFAGLAVAIGAVNSLFELHVHGTIYGHVFVWIMVVLVPWVIVGGLEDYVRPIDEVSDVGRVVNRLARWLVPPLVAIYFLILCAYVIRIAITRELPHNLISPMVIAAGLLSCIGLIIFDPDSDTAAGLKWLRITPWIFLPLAPLALWALNVRLAQYGWTELRLLRLLIVLALAALALIACVQMVRKGRLDLRAIPLLLGITMLVAAVGPWSIPAMSRRNQQHRLAAALVALHLDPQKAPADTAGRVINGRLYQRVDGAARYLADSFGDEAVTEVVPGYRAGAVSLTQWYHLTADVRTGPPAPIAYAQMPTGIAMATKIGDVYRIEATERAQVRSGNAWTSGDTLFVMIGADTAFSALGSLIAQMGGERASKNGGAQIPAAGAAFPVAMKHDATRSGYVTILEMTINRGSHRASIPHLSGILTLKGRQQ